MIKILYVEDEPFLAKIVKETLETKSYIVTLVSDGADAMKTYRSDSFDVCVLDIMLPNKSGYEIAQDIRIENENIPILFLTAKDQTADLLKGFQVGGNDYIKKPFSMEELIVRIENLISLRKSKAESNVRGNIALGDVYTFLPQKFELHHMDSIRTLSHRESQIIELLCDKLNQITERKVILQRVWGDDSYYNSRNLDVYINKIRGYFKDDPRLKIATLKGVGYQFICTD